MKIAFYNGSSGIYKLVANHALITSGEAKHQWLLAKMLISYGHEVLFITPTDDPGRIQPAIEGARFIASPCRTTNLSLRKILGAENPDWFMWLTNSMHLGPCFFIAKSLGIATAYVCASNKDCVPKHALNPLSFRKHFWPLYQWGLDQATRILAQHSGQRDLLGPRYAEKTWLVSNIAELPTIAKRPENPGSIVWVANLRAEKRPHLLVEIAKQLPQYKFVVCGAALDYRSQPGYAESISQTLSGLSNVDYRGAVPPHETLEIIANAALFLSTSDQEGFPNTMLESWSLGVPVVSLEFDPGGAIARHELGSVTANVADAIARIENLMHTPQELIRLGENGKRYVLENHSPPVIYRQMADALNLDFGGVHGYYPNHFE
jgi:glycosyltransferase involved in cell wall biosynthesis